MKEKYVQVRVTSGMKAAIEDEAARRGVSISTLIMLALVAYAPEIKERSNV